MKTLIVFLMMLVFSSSFYAFGQGDKSMQAEVIISGKLLLFFQVALRELEKKGLEASKYKVSLYRLEETYVVIFEDPSISLSQRGSSANMPSLEVKMSLDGKVIKSHFGR